VQSRIKELEKIVRIEIPVEEQAIHFSFPQPQPSGRTVVEVSDLAKNYGPKQVLEDVSFTIERGDRIALVGVNGAGKSTLIRMLSGMEPPSEGTLRLGHNVTAEYFAQDQYKVLDGNARMLDDMSNHAPRVSTTDLRSLLGCFLFSGDDVFKPLGVLSGGERNRYALARILVSPANFLLLDEPTNHLDLRAKDVLLEAIAAFNGTVVMVSHDRYFIDRLATRIFEVEAGHVHVYPGNYEDYLHRKEGAAGTASSNGAAVAVVPQEAVPVLVHATNGTSNGASVDTRVRRLNPIKLKQMQERCSFVEEEIPRVESSIADAEASLGVYESAEATQRLTQLLENLREQHAALNAEWEELVVTLEGQV
jgi:ATP-binding cassette subfamily F protein 3